MKRLLGFLPIVFGLPALELKKQRIGFQWNLKNNCGPRPSGPIYPHPPLNTNHNPQLPMHCDMIYDDLYVQGYKCNTTCQAVPEQEIQVECDCLRRIMGLTFPQPCKWVYKTMEGEKSDGCPAVPESMPQYDWQCDPRNGTCAEGQYGEPVISEWREYIPPPPLEDGPKKNPLSVKGKKSSDDESGDESDGEEDTEGSADEGSGEEDEDGLTQAEKAMKSVEIITDMLKKEKKAIEAAEHMRKDYEKLMHDKKVEEILYDSLGWKPPPTKKPSAHIVAQWNPGSIFGSEPNSTIIGGDKVFQDMNPNKTSTVAPLTTPTTTSASTIETIDIDYESIEDTTVSNTVLTTVEATTVVTVTIVEDDEIQDHDDRFDFDEDLYATESPVEPEIESENNTPDPSQMANDFIADEPVYEYEEEEEEIEWSNDFVAPEEEIPEDEIQRSPKVTNVAKMDKPVRNIVDDNHQLDLAAMGLQNEKAVTINIFNNQVYNQNASGEARLVNNHGQDLTFGDKVGQGGVIPPGANMGNGPRGQMRSMQHMVEQLIENGKMGKDNVDVMRQV